MTEYTCVTYESVQANRDQAIGYSKTNKKFLECLICNQDRPDCKERQPVLGSREDMMYWRTDENQVEE